MQKLNLNSFVVGCVQEGMMGVLFFNSKNKIAGKKKVAIKDASANVLKTYGQHINIANGKRGVPLPLRGQLFSFKVIIV